MMSYDNTCKFLAETFPTDFASWLLGNPIPLTKLEPSELSIEPIRADSVIFLGSSEIILHLEFQTRTDENMAFRMVDYWVRLHRKYPNKQIHQTVIYLKPINSELAYQTSFNSPQLTHNFNVIRLWEQPTETFQQYQGLLPLAVLTKTNNATETLKEVAKLIDNIEDQKLKSSLIGATYITSGLVLELDIIKKIFRIDAMKESVTYQEILLEGKAKGLAEGKAEGKALGLALGLAEGEVKGKIEERTQIAQNMMRSGLSIDLIAQFTGLTVEQIQKLQ